MHSLPVRDPSTRIRILELVPTTLPLLITPAHCNLMRSMCSTERSQVVPRYCFNGNVPGSWSKPDAAERHDNRVEEQQFISSLLHCVFIVVLNDQRKSSHRWLCFEFDLAPPSTFTSSALIVRTKVAYLKFKYQGRFFLISVISWNFLVLREIQIR